MARYTLHCFAQSGNAYKVALYLECSGLDWAPVHVDYFKGATRSADWRAENNEMGEAPVLETDGKRLTQSGAILCYLADTTGQFAPDDRTEALRWILFDNHKFTSYFATWRFMKSFGPAPPEPAVETFLRGRIDAAFGVVEKHIAARDFMLGAKPTIVDFSMIGYLYFGPEETGYDLPAQFPAIHAWTQRMQGLPGWKGPYDLMPGERLASKW
ncbi:MAG: glutathione S-transferase C-terminal domain-containing protein [Hyphomonadaceae bacterium]|nr:glutathione S-transferase C-terminal domain-containing protein [Hyphomonadaceae bacterium]